MKQSISIALLLFAIASAAPAQSPLYIQHDPSCMNQLDYQYTYTGKNLQMYSVAKNDNELYFFLLSDAQPTITANLPKGAVSCQNAPLTTSLMETVNGGGRLAYIVFRVQNGYRSMLVESGGYVTRSGTYFAFRSPNYDFAIDTANLDYARNLSQPGVASPVYLTGLRDYDCLRLYSFRLEPVRPESPRADVEVIPGIGIISDRTGRNGSEMEQNVYRLLKINGKSLDDYIYSACRSLAQTGNNSGSFITNPGTGNNPYDPYDPFIEPDKEIYNTSPSNQGGQQLADCPEQPGYGYHIVQPGESLTYIARTYNLEPRQLLTWNNIRDANKIEVCDKIWLSAQAIENKPEAAPATQYKYHVVQKSENLVGVARKYNITEASIRKWNNFPASGNVVIQPGQKLVVSKTAGSAANVPPKKETGQGQIITAMRYKVQKNESLTSLAQQYGYTTHYFRHLNRSNQNLLAVRDDDFLPEGLVLVVSDSKERIGFDRYVAPQSYGQSDDKRFVPITPDRGQPPPPPPLRPQTKFEYIGEHIVQQGETLASIARRRNLTVEKLAAANNLRPGQEPSTGTILKIPK